MKGIQNRRHSLKKKKKDKIGFILHSFRAYSKTSHEENTVLA